MGYIFQLESTYLIPQYILSIAQAVEHQGQKFASGGQPGDVADSRAAFRTANIPTHRSGAAAGEVHPPVVVHPSCVLGRCPDKDAHVDACITTEAALELHGLELVRDVGLVPMGFTVHVSAKEYPVMSPGVPVDRYARRTSSDV